MIITRTFDVDLIKSVVTSDTFWDSGTEDGAIKECYEPSLQKYVWLVVENDGVLVALIPLEHIGAVTVMVHFLVLKEHRKESRNIANCLLQWFNKTDYQKIITEIPEIYPHVIRFAAGAGLKQEGIRTKSHLKNGELIDMHLYGATKEEINKGF